MDSIEQCVPLLAEQLKTEINNLMISAQCLTSLVRESENPKYEEYFAIMNLCLYRLLRTARHLSDVDKLNSLVEEKEAAKKELVKEDPTTEEEPQNSHFQVNVLDLADLCRQLCAEVEPLAAKAEVKFSCTEAPVTLLIMGDERMLRQMLLNLISNAIRSAGHGGEAGIRLTTVQGRGIITVWDNGPKTELSGEKTLKTKSLTDTTSGIGLGRLIVQQVAALHGGTLVFGTQEGRGNQAVVSLDITMPKKPPKTDLHTPKTAFDPDGGYSLALVELSDVLPVDLFYPEDVE